MLREILLLKTVDVGLNVENCMGEMWYLTVARGSHIYIYAVAVYILVCKLMLSRKA